MSTEPEVSIAAVTYRNLDATQKFIDSVQECTKSPYQLVVVDNGSPEDVAAYLDSLESKIPHYKLIRNPSNLGIGVGMNQAMRACTTGYIFRCDTDVEIKTAYWTQFMRELVDRYPEVGAVGTAITGGHLKERSSYTETDLCLSNCMLIPRKTIETIDRVLHQELDRIRRLVVADILGGNPLFRPRCQPPGRRRPKQLPYQ